MKRLSAFHYHQTSGKFKGVHRFVFLFCSYERLISNSIEVVRFVFLSKHIFYIIHMHIFYVLALPWQMILFGYLIFFVVKHRGTEITNQFFDSHLKNQFQTSDFR